MICRFCGAQLPENTMYCHKCGKEVQEPSPTPSPAPAQVRTVCIRFLDADGQILQATDYRIGERIVAPKVKKHIQRDGIPCYFAGWEPAIPSAARSSTDFRAIYSNASAPITAPSTQSRQSAPEKKENHNDAVQPSTAPHQPSKKSKKLWIAVCLSLLLLSILLSVWRVLHNISANKPTDDPPIGENNDPLPEELPEDDPPVTADWSLWTANLPTAITQEAYEIETRTVYRSSALETTTSTTEDSMDGWELYDTAENSSDKGSWSSWITDKIKKSKTKEVQTKTQYRSRVKETATASSPTKSGWTLDYTEPAVWSNWSAWSISAIEATASREVERATVYRCSIRSGGFWSEWSAWSPDVISASSHCEVQQMPGYRYRTLQKAAVYHFYRLGSWSDWSDKEISATATLLVEPRTLYRSRTVTIETTYYFQRWGDWSDWTDQPITESDELRVESMVEYRYRPKS